MEIKAFICLLFAVGGMQLATAQEKFTKVIVGELNRDVFTTDEEFKKWFNKNYQTRFVNESLSDSLKTTLSNRTIVVVLGTWCSDSQEHVPHLFKILDSISFPVRQLKIYGVDRDKKLPPAIIEAYKIAHVPTIIVFDAFGSELGRITEAPVQSIEQDLAGIK